MKDVPNMESWCATLDDGMEMEMEYGTVIHFR